MKKILIFSVAYHPFVGGAEVAIKEITDRISPTDIEFHMLTVNLDGKQKAVEQMGNVRVYRVGKGSLGKLFFPFIGVWKALSLHKQYRYTSTWAMMANYAGFAALFFKYLKPKVPFLLSLQEGDPISYIKRQVWFVYPLFIQIFKRANSIQAISHYLANFAKSMGYKGQVLVIPNGVDVELFTENFPKETTDELVEKIGKKPDDILLIHTGRLVAKNGVADVISALAVLPKHVKFLSLGSGKLEAELKKQAIALRVDHRVIFVPFVPQTDIPLYLKVADIFIRPSLSEGMGNSFIEAMAAKKLVIGTNVGGIPDFLTDGKTGFVCEPKNPKSIARTVERIMDISPEQYNSIIDRAYRRAVNYYDWKFVANDMVKHFF